MKKELNAVVSQDGDWFVAQCLDVDVASQGVTEQEALENLRDALKLHFTPPVATILPNAKCLQVRQSLSQPKDRFQAPGNRV